MSKEYTRKAVSKALVDRLLFDPSNIVLIDKAPHGWFRFRDLLFDRLSDKPLSIRRWRVGESHGGEWLYLTWMDCRRVDKIWNKLLHEHNNAAEIAVMKTLLNKAGYGKIE
jgi:hypothetical protein